MKYGFTLVIKGKQNGDIVFEHYAYNTQRERNANLKKFRAYSKEMGLEFATSRFHGDSKSPLKVAKK